MELATAVMEVTLIMEVMAVMMMRQLTMKARRTVHTAGAADKGEEASWAEMMPNFQSRPLPRENGKGPGHDWKLSTSMI
ncbi:MAG: hypothetical protein ABIJ25_14625 [Pseudomonadota bacterium]|nr:hypothetical protein [Patescibacteria group bacterium]